MITLRENKDLGLLILRVGIGLMFFLTHGLPKLMAGPDMWTQIGAALSRYGITFLPVFWGLLAALSEGLGGLLLVLGIGTRTAATFMAFTMLIAAMHHLLGGDGIGKASHAIEVGILFLSLIWLGSGKYALRPSK
ncbi:MAG: DoxX family protein [Candidatus Omnitrophota bacterium]